MKLSVRGKMAHSLRGRLLWYLLAAITIAAVAQASIAYRTALADADQIFDYHMQQMALSLRSARRCRTTRPRRAWKPKPPAATTTWWCRCGPPMASLQIGRAHV